MFFFPHLLIEFCPHKTCPETVTIYFLLIGAYECQPADYLIMLKTPTVYSSCCFFLLKVSHTKMKSGFPFWHLSVTSSLVHRP